MKKLDKESLKKLREDYQSKEKERIILRVGLGTCGIAAGAEEAMKTLQEEIGKQDIKDYTIQRTGCMGYCYCEPNVEVIMRDMPPIIYGNVNKEVAKKIVVKHLLHKKLVNGHVVDRPSPDIMQLR